MEVTKEVLERIAAEERELVFDSFDSAAALELGRLMVRKASENGYQIAIDIRRTNQMLFHAAMPGAGPDNDEWVRRKTNVVFRFQKSSLAVGVALALLGLKIEEKYFVSSMEYSAYGGSFPIRVKSAGIVAAATVSGLPQEEDHEFVVACFRDFLKK